MASKLLFLSLFLLFIPSIEGKQVNNKKKSVESSDVVEKIQNTLKIWDGVKISALSTGYECFNKCLTNATECENCYKTIPWTKLGKAFRFLF